MDIKPVVATISFRSEIKSGLAMIKREAVLRRVIQRYNRSVCDCDVNSACHRAVLFRLYLVLVNKLACRWALHTIEEAMYIWLDNYGDQVAKTSEVAAIVNAAE
eukprot:scaffold643943_cov19-Prasinocladus_malaysianus.AAC.1